MATWGVSCLGVWLGLVGCGDDTGGSSASASDSSTSASSDSQATTQDATTTTTTTSASSSSSGNDADTTPPATTAPTTTDPTATTGGTTTTTGDTTTTGGTTTTDGATDCGDGIVDPGEGCDDGNLNDGDGCDANCTVTGCGNGLVTAGEECDGGAECDASCHFRCASGAGPDRVVVGGGSCYAGFDGEALTFQAAQSFCQSLGGHLPAVKNATENSLVRSASLLGENPWLGGSDSNVEGSFTWVTGEPFAFTAFAAGQPDDDVDLGGSGDCLSYEVDSEDWSDTNCSLTDFVTGTVCEFGVGLGAGKSFAAGDGARNLTAGDFDADGDVDLAVSNYNSNDVTILLGTGDGKFQAQFPTFLSAVGPLDILSADLDGDDALDLVVVNGAGPNLLFGNGDATFGPAQSLPTATAGGGPTGAIVDLDDDGALDLVITDNVNNADPNGANLFFGNGDGTFLPPQVLDMAGAHVPSSVGVGDLDGDGLLDVVTTDTIGGCCSYLTMRRGSGGGTFQAPETISTQGIIQKVLLGSFNALQDSTLDVFVIDDNASSSVYLGKGDGTFLPPKAVPMPFSQGFPLTADMNQDGLLDLIVPAISDDAVQVLLGIGNGTFQQALVLTAGQTPAGAAVADFNGDGNPDLAVANVLTDNVTVFLNQF